MAEQRPGTEYPRDREAESASLSQSFSSTILACRELGAAWLDLVGTEARNAAHAVFAILAMVGAVAVVGTASWLFLVGAAVAFAVRLGVPAELALIIAAVLHVIAVLVLVFAILRLSRRLSFPETRDAIHQGREHNERRNQTQTGAAAAATGQRT